MYKALIDLDSLHDPSVLSGLDIKETYEEKWEGHDPEILRISKILIPSEVKDQFVKSLSEEWIESEWFAVIWNETSVFVVFKGKVLELHNRDPWDEREFSELVEYGRSQNIDKKFFLNMRKVMEEW